MRGRSEAGVTLVELVIGVAVIGIVVPALAGAFIVGFRTLADTGDRVSESSSAEIATAYWGADVMNATAVSLAAVGCPVPGDPVVSFAVVSGYVTWFVSSTDALVRRECGTFTSDTTIAGSLSVTSTPAAVCADINCNGRVTLTLPQAGQGGEYVTELSATRRNTDA